MCGEFWKRTKISLFPPKETQRLIEKILPIELNLDNIATWMSMKILMSQIYGNVSEKLDKILMLMNISRSYQHKKIN